VFEFRLTEGSFNRKVNKPVIGFVSNGRPDGAYLWIGNGAENDQACFGTLHGLKTLRRLAREMLSATEPKRLSKATK
jgi:hypothetical protein